MSLFNPNSEINTPGRHPSIGHKRFGTLASQAAAKQLPIYGCALRAEAVSPDHSGYVCDFSKVFLLQHFNPNYQVEENARPGGRGRHPRSQPFGRATVRAGSARFSVSEVFREGAENGARGGRAPGSGAEFGINPLCPSQASLRDAKGGLGIGAVG